MIFLDLVKVYNVFYIMTMEVLDRYKKMSSSEMSKALVLYKNFCNFTETLKKEANTIPMLFGFTFKEPNYYKSDANKERAMKNAMKDKESGGYDEDQEGSFGEEIHEVVDQDVGGHHDYEDEKAEEGEDSDDDYNFDILGDVKKQEEMASVHGAKRSATIAGPKKKEKIRVDDFNTAALDDLLGGDKPATRSETVKVSSGYQGHDDQDEGWDPFAHNEDNVYSTQKKTGVPKFDAKPAASSNTNNIFGDDEDDMWGGNQAPVSSKPQTKTQKETLDDILGGIDLDSSSVAVGGRSQTMKNAPSDFDMLKNLYNTTAINNQSSMGMGQQDYYNTGAAGYGGGMDPGMGYGHQNYGTGMGYGQQNQYNTGYGQGYPGYGQGYNTSAGYGYQNNNLFDDGNNGTGTGPGYNTGANNNYYGGDYNQ